MESNGYPYTWLKFDGNQLFIFKRAGFSCLYILQNSLSFNNLICDIKSHSNSNFAAIAAARRRLLLNALFCISPGPPHGRLVTSLNASWYEKK
jgi:hypothetical protein